MYEWQSEIQTLGRFRYEMQREQLPIARAAIEEEARLLIVARFLD